MGLRDKAFAKALSSLNMDDLAQTLTDSLYSQLSDAGHHQVSIWASNGWRVTCDDCDFTAQGSSVGERGKAACDAMAAVHLGEVRA